MTGPLQGLRIIEMAGIGPGPFACMMLADHGADVIRVERMPPGERTPGDAANVLLRSRRTLSVDMTSPDGVAVIRDLCRSADGLVEGFRPGVMERRGLGPDLLLSDNPKLVYGRMTGWGQDGPYAREAGHDINYIALSGTLHALGRAGDKPTPPINLVGDFGGGGMVLAFGMVAALLHARATGQGQVVDCAMTDGSALLMSMIWSFRAQGMWQDQRGVNLLDGGAPFYDTYETADGGYISLGSIEPVFYGNLLCALGLTDDPDFTHQMDPAHWPRMKQRLVTIIRQRTRQEWCQLLEGHDICFAPVLSMAEAVDHPHNRARGAFIAIDGVTQPAPAPRFSHTPPAPPRPLQSQASTILAGIGYDDARVAALRDAGIIG
ncbi:CaiB/BaiF CoA-transferase family protein [Niveispirillum sp. BGYR6]|uniref:CaiB/BaiF CoA transferase family protein n=1 Tax=Niveispirillum sp. BGYR6 TaxID=2971249 RepID=UPI0022B9C925|nr:CaiB/BaiF CoA-transferase family protein [Niveispirillum sp. BGYR6]MDG5498023.1 CaiB/BaiF CoA-transferase family protein [Niveispirillum sp. BGYR6]